MEESPHLSHRYENFKSNQMSIAYVPCIFVCGVLGEDFASSFWVHAEDGNSKFL
jgi:hypothetical protein